MSDRYKIPCTTEGIDVFAWADAKPTECPNDAAHTIDSDGIVLVAFGLEPRTVDGTPIMTDPEWALGQKMLARIDDDTVAMNIDGSYGAVTVLWNGTGGTDTGGDWSRSGSGSETTAAKNSGTNGLDTTKEPIDSECVFDNGSMTDLESSYETLELYVRAKSRPIGSDPTIFFRDSSDDQVGDKVHLNDYVNDWLDEHQKVGIPLADFNLSGNVQKLVIKLEGVADQRYFVDDIGLVATGGHTFRAKAPSDQAWHVQKFVLLLAETNSGWAPGDFTNLSKLTNGLLIRHRRLSTGQVFWKMAIATNRNLFGRLLKESETDLSSSRKLYRLILEARPPVKIRVSDDDVVEVLVRDDLSTIDTMRAFVEFGAETEVP